MSGSAKMFHIAPTTLYGISSGIAISTRQTDTPMPLRGIASAIATPSGISIASTIAGEQQSGACSASRKRCDFITCSNQRTPSKKNSLLPKVSCTE